MRVGWVIVGAVGGIIANASSGPAIAGTVMNTADVMATAAAIAGKRVAMGRTMASPPKWMNPIVGRNSKDRSDLKTLVIARSSANVQQFLRTGVAGTNPGSVAA